MSDYISREAAKLAVVDVAQSCENGFKWGEAVTFTPSKIIRLLEIIPAADVAPVRRGKWIRGNESATSPVHDSYTCSVCGDKALAGYFGSPVRTNYCPNCGCEMGDGNHG